tara:strand:+ start:540 stop:869 length:330 start_codon:yes stop_codon:yes gene_type:complete
MHISTLIKEGIAKRKKQGVAWGNPDMRTTAVPASLKVRKDNARQFNDKILFLIKDMIKGEDRPTYDEIASRLNKLGLRTRRGSTFAASNVFRIMKRVELVEDLRVVSGD